MLIAAVGILLSIIGIFAVRTKENATMKDLLGAPGLRDQPQLGTDCRGYLLHSLAIEAG